MYSENIQECNVAYRKYWFDIEKQLFENIPAKKGKKICLDYLKLKKESL